jgi:hypothetical protein
MPEIVTVLLFALLPAVGNFTGSLLAESVRTPKWLIGASLHAAAGIAVGVVSFDLMPRMLASTVGHCRLCNRCPDLGVARSRGETRWRPDAYQQPSMDGLCRYSVGRFQ